jgi:hypothetical protein
MPEHFFSAIKSRIEKGIQLLDHRRPDWLDSIDIDRLDMKLSEHCMLGQVFGSFDKGMSALNLSDDDAVRCAFKLNRAELTTEIPVWNREWKRALRFRLRRRN